MLAVLAPQPQADVVAELERLLAEARAGKVQSLVFAASRSGLPGRYGSVGDYDLRDIALAIALMQRELDALISIGEEEAMESTAPAVDRSAMTPEQASNLRALIDSHGNERTVATPIMYSDGFAEYVLLQALRKLPPDPTTLEVTGVLEAMHREDPTRWPWRDTEGRSIVPPADLLQSMLRRLA